MNELVILDTAINAASPWVQLRVCSDAPRNGAWNDAVVALTWRVALLVQGRSAGVVDFHVELPPYLVEVQINPHGFGVLPPIFASASAGGIWPMGFSRRSWLNQCTHCSVASSSGSLVLRAPRSFCTTRWWFPPGRYRRSRQCTLPKASPSLQPNARNSSWAHIGRIQTVVAKPGHEI